MIQTAPPGFAQFCYDGVIEAIGRAVEGEADLGRLPATGSRSAVAGIPSSGPLEASDD